ncbi:hypothetical protein [Frondihabitans australicus]|uniref:Uncharacterized protein n=1 Tax=Frondihabitans australicus TaxID=386892 RepID=A0A495IHY4_9MICO|nr:hypothetical protein [Frondihabitans australicus]RKR75584.1 hypothetical protein C8E83_2732 [Frondihabitans australicus]
MKIDVIASLTSCSSRSTAFTEASPGLFQYADYLGRPVYINKDALAGKVGDTSDPLNAATMTQSVHSDETGARVDLAQTNLRDGDTYRLGTNVFSGTGTPGGTVTLETTSFTSSPVSTTVADDGRWSLARSLGTGPYTVKLTQTAQGSTDVIDGIRLSLFVQPTVKPFTVSAKNGDTYRVGNVTFTGTGDGTAANTVTLDVTSPKGLGSVTVPVAKDGTWTLVRPMGTGPYTVSFTEKTASGAVLGVVGGITLRPNA